MNVWNKIYSEQEWGKYPTLGLIRFIASNFYKLERPKVKILELGCGPGANIWYLSREGFDSHGIDASSVAINRAREWLRREGLKATLTCGEIGNLPYEDSQFDAVIDIECLCCNSSKYLEGILREISRVLKPNGLLYSQTFSADMNTDWGGENQFEFEEINKGPFVGKGFLRLSTEKHIYDYYGKIFNIKSLDYFKHTVNNRELAIEEWSIIASKKL